MWIGSVKPFPGFAHHKLPLLQTEFGAKKVIAVSVCKTEGNALHGMRTFLIKYHPCRIVSILARYSGDVKQKIAYFEKSTTDGEAGLNFLLLRMRIFGVYF